MQRKTIKKRLVLKKEIKQFINKVLISIILFLSASILIKENPKYRMLIKEKIYEDSFKFAKLKTIYEKNFGAFLSLDKIIKESQPVFSENISYTNKEKYQDGVELTVEPNYLVPTLESGIIVYIGEKENYGKTIIVEQINGIDVFYSNIEPINLNIYDYVEKGELLGETKSDKLYLMFQKNGQIVDYKNYV